MIKDESVGQFYTQLQMSLNKVRANIRTSMEEEVAILNQINAIESLIKLDKESDKASNEKQDKQDTLNI